MGFRYPGPECPVRNRFVESIDPGTKALTKHAPPKPAGHHQKHKRRPKRKIKVAVFHPKNLVGFLHSAARAKSMAKHFELVYVEPKDQSWYEKVIPGGERILTVSFGGREKGDEKKVEDDAHKNFNELKMEFARRLAEGPKSVKKFMEEQERARQRNVNLIVDMYAKANPAHNRWVEPILAELIMIKLAGTICWKVAGELVEAPIFVALDFGRDVAIEVLSSWEELENAEVMVSVLLHVAKDAVTDTVQAITEHKSEVLEEKLSEWAESGELSAFFKHAFTDADQYLGEKTKKEFAKQMKANAGRFKKAARPFTFWKLYGKACKAVVKVGWLAYNVREAISTAGEDWEKAQVD
jgi:hypothetical protein